MLNKDHEENVNVTFDFGPMVTALGLVGYAATYGDPTYFAEDYTADMTEAALLSPQIELARDFGDAILIATTPPTVNGLRVTQQFSGGTPDCVYDVACVASFTNGEHRRLSATLAVS